MQNTQTSSPIDYMNHPYNSDRLQRVHKKKILAMQQAVIRGYLSDLKENALVMGVGLGVMYLGLLLVLILDGESPKIMILVEIPLLVPLSYIGFYLWKKKHYEYILRIGVPQTVTKQMNCTRVKLWVIHAKDGIGIIGVWLYADTDEKYLYIYPLHCRDKKHYTLFPESKVRNEIKAIFLNHSFRFSCYENTDIIHGFVQ